MYKIKIEKLSIQRYSENEFPNGTEAEAKSFPDLRNRNGNRKSTEIYRNGIPHSPNSVDGRFALKFLNKNSDIQQLIYQKKFSLRTLVFIIGLCKF